MGLFNEHSSSLSNAQGIRGPQGIGFKLDAHGSYDIENKKLTNVQNGDMNHDVMVKSQIEGYVDTNFIKKAGDTMVGDLIVQKDNYPVQGDLNKVISYEAQREIFLSKMEGGQMHQPIDMNGFTIDNLKSPTDADHAASKGYVDDKVNSKADTIDLDNYLKLDGTKAMTGNINMDNNRIVRLPNPQLADEPVTRKFLTQTNTLFYNIFLDLDGNAQMRANLKMNGNNITGLSNPPDANDQATNKEYVDSQISKANIKPSHTPKNVFQYLMNDVNEWSSEYNIKVGSFSDLAESPHSWEKRVLNITPVKDGNNYRFRLGLQMFPLQTNSTYSLIIELFNRDYKTWLRQQTYIEITGIWLKSYNTTKFQHQYGSSGVLYYTKTLIKFKKTSSSAPIFIYYTVHFDDNNGDMSTYPTDFKNQVYIVAYGIVGETDHVESGVYDAHEAYEIFKNRMEMNVDLDLNTNKLLNVSNVSLIYIYGMINSRSFFTASSMQLRLGSLFLFYIYIYPPKKYQSQQDVILVSSLGANYIRFPFTYYTQSGKLVIQINQYFDRINYIKMLKGANMPFQLVYKVFY